MHQTSTPRTHHSTTLAPKVPAYHCVSLHLLSLSSANCSAHCPQQVPKLIVLLVGGFSLAAVRFHHEGGEVVSTRFEQGIVGHLCLRARFDSGPRGGRASEGPTPYKFQPVFIR